MTEELPTLARGFGKVPFAAFVAIVVLAAISLVAARCLGKGRRPRISTLAWLLPEVGALGFLTLYTRADMVLSHEQDMINAVELIAIAAAVVLLRDWVLPPLLGTRPDKSAATDAAAATNTTGDANAAKPMPAHTVEAVERTRPKPAHAAPVEAPATAETASVSADADNPEVLIDKNPDGEDSPAAPLARIRPGRFAAHLLVTLVALAGLAFFGTLAMETPIQPDPLGAIDQSMFLVEFGLAALAGLTLYLLAQRHGALAALVPAVLMVFGIANYFVLGFKNTVVLPSDLLALNTAAEVAGGYTYEITNQVVTAISYACVAWACCAWLVPTVERPLVPSAVALKLGGRATRAISCLLLFALSATGLYAATNLIDYRANGVVIDYWNPKSRYLTQGTLTSFVAMVQDMPIPKPDGYSATLAEALTKRYAGEYDQTIGSSEQRQAAVAQYEQQKPTVIFVMNETFSDLSIYDGLKTGYEGPTFYKTGISDAVDRGALAVSVLGGGTCNTEFEALTGESMLYAGLGKYPFNMYGFSDVSNIVRQMSDEGYATTAMHPNVGTNWHRNIAYDQLGFDKFLTIEDFEGAPTFHNGVTDRATYDKVLELLANDPNPQFIFDVTMQNHSGYDVGNIPAERLTDYQPEGISADVTAELNEYVSCIQASDEDLEYFVGELRKLDRPVVLVFFGDHQPALSNDLNEAWFTDESEVDHAERPYRTTYTIWANYDVAGASAATDEGYSASAYLAAQTLNIIGAPLTDYQKAQLVARQSMPAFNGFGIMSADGTWSSPKDESSAAYATNEDLASMSYLNFATKVS